MTKVTSLRRTMKMKGKVNKRAADYGGPYAASANEPRQTNHKKGCRLSDSPFSGSLYSISLLVSLTESYIMPGIFSLIFT